MSSTYRTEHRLDDGQTCSSLDQSVTAWEGTVVTLRCASLRAHNYQQVLHEATSEIDRKLTGLLLEQTLTTLEAPS